MSPWPAVVTHTVFVERANSVRYLLCSRFISENCIVPPFGEWVMECGRKPKVCHFPAFWQYCITAKRLTHPASRLNTGSGSPALWCVCFLKRTDSVLLSQRDCLWNSCSRWESLARLPFDLFYLLTQPPWWAHSPRRLGEGLMDAAFWSHLTSTAMAHLTHAPWRRRHAWRFYDVVNPAGGVSKKPHVGTACKQVGDTWEFLRAQVHWPCGLPPNIAVPPSLFRPPQLYQKGLSTHTWNSLKTG